MKFGLVPTLLESRIWRRISVAASVAIFFAALPGVGAQENELDEVAMLAAVNAERAGLGLDPLTWNNLLEEAALGHTVDMWENDFMSHTGSDGSSMVDRINATGYSWSRISENVARGYTSVGDVMSGWMGSDGHRANILDPDVTEMGAAMVGNFWTQNFGSPSSGVPSDDDPDGGGGGGGGGGSGGGGGTPEASDLPGHYASLASYYYYFHSYFGDWEVALSYYYYYSGLSQYWAYAGLGMSAEALWSYYFNLALSYYYMVLSVGDYAGATWYYYSYLAYAYYVYYMGYGDAATAVAMYYQVLYYAYL